jgi:hypothetical protein
MKSLILALAATAALTTGAAQAALITYTFAGSGTFTLNGEAEASAFSFSYVGDTNNITGTYENVIVPGNSTFTFGTTAVTLTGDVNKVLVNPTAPGFGGFLQLAFSPFNVAAEAITGPFFQTYDLSTATSGIITGGLSVGAATFHTAGGDLVFGRNGIESLNFSAVGGVPEPSTWAMMLAGFAGLGWLRSARRREGRAATA